MERWLKRDHPTGILFFVTLGLCALLAGAVAFLAIHHGGNNVYSFSEPVLTLSDGWTLTDGAGNERAISLPATIPYGTDGVYTLSCTLPADDALITSPAFRFYSNYVGVRIALDGQALYAFPEETAAFSGATGNTYHFVRLPSDYAGKTVAVTIFCELGSDITYLVNPPLLGSKATMLKRDVMQSLPLLTLAGCMCTLAIGLNVLYFVFHKRLSLNKATLYTALFTLLFAVYVGFETSFAQIFMPNGYLLCFATLLLLALVPIPLIGIFLNAVGRRFRPLLYALMGLCAANFAVQLLLNLTGVKSVRAMLPATHAVMLLSITLVSLALFLSDRTEKPGARRSLVSAVPMVLGGITDIVLLNLNRPSPNNCFFFALGVTAFIISELCGFIGSYFALYRTALEAKLLADMAYRDALAGIGNRNAYERKLKALSKKEPPCTLCCIVADINDLKVINDTLGHGAGDAAIAQVGSILCESMPACASFFRTDGDEFVVLLEEYDGPRTKALAEALSREAERRGALCSIPLRLAIGFGQYEESDGNIIDFIRRVDTRMYACKRRQKSEQCMDCGRTAGLTSPAKGGEADAAAAH